MLTQSTVNTVMSKVMKDVENGLINEDTMFMIETVLTEGNPEELMDIVGSQYYKRIEKHISNSTYVLVEWNWECEGITQTKVCVNYFDEWLQRENYPEYRIIKKL